MLPKSQKTRGEAMLGITSPRQPVRPTTTKGRYPQMLISYFNATSPRLLFHIPCRLLLRLRSLFSAFSRCHRQLFELYASFRGLRGLEQSQHSFDALSALLRVYSSEPRTWLYLHPFLLSIFNLILLPSYADFRQKRDRSHHMLFARLSLCLCSENPHALLYW